MVPAFYRARRAGPGHSSRAPACCSHWLPRNGCAGASARGEDGGARVRAGLPVSSRKKDGGGLSRGSWRRERSAALPDRRGQEAVSEGRVGTAHRPARARPEVEARCPPGVWVRGLRRLSQRPPAGPREAEARLGLAVPTPAATVRVHPAAGLGTQSPGLQLGLWSSLRIRAAAAGPRTAAPFGERAAPPRPVPSTLAAQSRGA